MRRANLYSGAKRKKEVYSSKYALSSIIYCSKCGDIYRRIAWNNRGKHSTVWRCCTCVEHGLKKCDAPTIQESDLQDAVVNVIQEVLGEKEVYLPVLEGNIRAVLESESGEQIAERDRRRNRIEEMSAFLRKQANEPLAYDEPLVRRLVEKITVYEDRLAVGFKSELEIDVER